MCRFLSGIGTPGVKGRWCEGPCGPYEALKNLVRPSKAIRRSIGTLKKATTVLRALGCISKGKRVLTGAIKAFAAAGLYTGGMPMSEACPREAFCGSL